MAAPCINDTCSITSTIDPVTRRLALDVRVNANGGLSCHDGAGLGIEMYGGEDDGILAATDAQINDACFNQLAMMPGGQLASISRRAVTRIFSSPPVGVPQDGQAHATASTVVTNPFGCSALAIVSSSMQFGYIVAQVAEAACLETGSNQFWVPYSGVVRMQTLLDNNALLTTYKNLSGVHRRGDTKSNKRIWDYGVAATLIGPSAAVGVNASALLVSPDTQAQNIITNNDNSFADLGIAVAGQVLFLPMGRE